jgi:hypothetical protein
MAKLIYAANVSLDGCTEDERGAFDWARSSSAPVGTRSSPSAPVVLPNCCPSICAGGYPSSPTRWMSSGSCSNSTGCTGSANWHPRER